MPLIPRAVKLHFKFQLSVRKRLFLRLFYLTLYYLSYFLSGKDHGRAMTFLKKTGLSDIEVNVILPDGLRMLCTLYDIFLPVKELYVDNIYRVPGIERRLGDGGHVVLDIGAHVGGYTMAAARSYARGGGRVISFEPHPENFRRLKANVEQNGLSNVTVVNAALSDKSGEMQLFVSDASGSHSLFAGQGRSVTVAAKTLDSALGELQVPKIDAIKMDTEGAELTIFAGAAATLSSSKPAIIMECHDTEAQAKDMLEKYGYRVTVFNGNYLYAE